MEDEGVPGEICVAGSCLAAGYYNRPDLTAAAFPQDPRRQSIPAPIYRTGDIGCYRDGLLMFLGRRDTQVKHMGHRIELSEIELAANAAEGVEVACCLYLPDRARLLLFYQGSAEPGALSAALAAKLPRYMLPAQVIPLADFPRTRTGKIDRTALLAKLKGE